MHKKFEGGNTINFLKSLWGCKKVKITTQRVKKVRLGRRHAQIHIINNYERLKNTVGGWGKKTHNKNWKKSIIIGWQITKDGEDREKGRIEKRKAA